MRKTASCALKRFLRTTSPKFTMMCAKRAFLRTPEVEQHGEHRFFPMTRVSSTILQHHTLSFSASLVTLIVLSPCVVPKKTCTPIEYIRAGRTQKSPEEKSPGLCDPNRIQTYNLLIRSQMLYSIELWDQFRSNDLYFDSAYFVAPSSLRITIFFSLILAFFPESALR